ncbi:hypothetical protein LTR60_002839, partial [Cryomyces antarcticus]
MKGDVNYRPPPNAKVNMNVNEADGGAEPGTGQLTRRAKEPTNSLATSHSGIPAPVVSAAEKCLNTATSSADAAQRTGTDDTVGSKSSYADPEIWAKYLTLGAYGSSWMGWGKKEPKERSSILRQESNDGTKAVKPEDHGSPPIEPSLKHIEPQPEGASEEAKLAQQRHLETSGHFVIGLKGDLTLENSDEHMDTYSSGGSSESGGSRTLLRTLYVETADGRRTNYEDDDGERGAINRETITPSDSVSSGPKYQRMRVLVYVHRPFIYTLLFEQRTPSLSMSSFYHNLRHHFIPLHKALCSSTSPSKVAHRIVDARTSPPQPESINPKHPPYDPPKNSPIFDLVFDPRTLTVHTSIPNIPEPGTSAAEGISTTSTRKDTPPRWTRLEALNVHVQILNTLASTRRATHDLERTCKTSRGWWVVWMRLPPSAQGEDAREAFLVRKASDYIAPVGKTSRVSSGMFGLGGRSEQARSGGRGPGSLADGIGIDARSQEGAHVGEDVTSKDSVGDAKGKKAKTGAGKKGNGPKRQSSSDELLMGEHQSVSFEMSVRNKTDEVTQEVLGDKRPSPSASALETEVEDATREHEDDIAQFPVNDDGLMALPSNPACTPGANVVEAREQISSSKWQAARNEDVEQTPGIQPPVDEMASSLREEPAHKMPEASKTAEKEQSPFLYEQQKVDQAELHPEAVDKETTAEDPIISAQKTARHQYDHSAERNLCQVERTSVQNGSPDATAPLDHASSRTSADMADALQKSPKPVKRLEDSIEAIDALEEAIEEIGKALPGVDMPAASTTPCKSVAIHASSKTDGSGVSGLRKMPASDIKTNGRPSTISRTTSTRKPVAPKKDINAAAT